MNSRSREGVMTDSLFRKLLIPFLLLAGLCLPGVAVHAADCKTVDAETLYGWMKTKAEPITLINVMSLIECLDHRIPGSLCISREEFESRLSEVPREGKVILYCETETGIRSCQAGEAALRRGMTNIYILKGGMPAWKAAGYSLESVQRVARVPVQAIKALEYKSWRSENWNALILDIRSEAVFAKDHLPEAVNIPMYQLHKRYGELPENRPILIVDDQGFRTFLAASYLFQKGFHNLSRLFGGMNAWHAIKGK